jgi:hypothetical protein
MKNQLHGLWGVAVADEPNKTQEVTVSDGAALVWLRRTAYANAGLTPRRSRLVRRSNYRSSETRAREAEQQGTPK